MAQKKITDLQLIDAVTSGISIPTDDGIQSYRFTAAQMKSFILANENILLAMLKTDIFDGLTSVSAADDDYFILNDTSDSNKMKKALISTFARNLYRSVSSYPATVASTDGTMKLSGSSGTITLPTAVGIDGKQYKFIHNGTTGSQVYTLATTSGQTINQFASAALKLSVNGEYVIVESDGANWVIVSKNLRIFASAYNSSSSYSGSSTNPINFDTVIQDYWSTITTGASWKFIAPEAGVYQFNATVSVAGGSTASTQYFAINGTKTYHCAYVGVGTTGSGSAIIPLASGDYVQVIGSASNTQNGGGPSYASHFQALKNPA